MNLFVIARRWISNLVVYRNNLNNERDYSVWIFGEWFGKRCSDNSLSFANYVAENDVGNLQLYWLCDVGVDTSALNHKVTVVDRLSAEGIELQKRAGVAVMNQGYDDFSKNGDNYLGNAITVNLWHGIMWKKIGYDAYKNDILAKAYISSIKDKKGYKLFCSPSSRYTDLFSTAFRINENCSINAGYPRNAIFYDKVEIEQARNKVFSILSNYNVKIDDDINIITYMPTFRDNTSTTFSFNELNDSKLTEFLTENNCIIIQKSHQVNVKRGTGFGSNSFDRIINIEDINPQQLLAASNVLITDYSSCLFDFLLLDRPIIQFLYDYEYYSQTDRGLYYDPDLVDCGNLVFSEKELLNSIKDALLYPDKHSEKRMMVKKQFLEYESIDSNSIIFNRILEEISLVHNEDNKCKK